MKEHRHALYFEGHETYRPAEEDGLETQRWKAGGRAAAHLIITIIFSWVVIFLLQYASKRY